MCHDISHSAWHRMTWDHITSHHIRSHLITLNQACQSRHIVNDHVMSCHAIHHTMPYHIILQHCISLHYIHVIPYYVMLVFYFTSRTRLLAYMRIYDYRRWWHCFKDEQHDVNNPIFHPLYLAVLTTLRHPRQGIKLMIPALQELDEIGIELQEEPVWNRDKRSSGVYTGRGLSQRDVILVILLGSTTLALRNWWVSEFGTGFSNHTTTGQHKNSQKLLRHPWQEGPSGLAPRNGQFDLIRWSPCIESSKDFSSLLNLISGHWRKVPPKAGGLVCQHMPVWLVFAWLLKC